VGHLQQLGPLFLVEGHGKTSEAVDGHAAFFADTQARAAASRALQAFILGAQSLQFAFQIVVAQPRTVTREQSVPQGPAEEAGTVGLRSQATFRRVAVNRLTNSSAFSATSRHPASIVSA